MSIKPKEKACKGESVAKGFGCGKTSVNRKYGLSMTGCRCYQYWLLNSEAGKQKLSKSLMYAAKPRLQIEQQKEDLNKAFEQKKDRSKISYLLTNVMNVCHEYIRLRDKGKNCISCNGLWSPEFQAGHFYKAQLFSSLKFNEFNISGQCQGCNLFKEGNESQYRVGFINRYGKEKLSELDYLAEQEKRTAFKWDRYELERLRKYYQDKIKDLRGAK